MNMTEGQTVAIALLVAVLFIIALVAEIHED